MELYIKLNIQRFATTVTSNAYETGVDNNNNLSYVYATFTQVAASNTWNTSGSAYYNISCDGKSTGNVSFTFSKGSTKTFSATLGPYYHNADGTLGAKTVTIVVHGDVSGGNHTNTHTVTFTTIPRYFSSTPSISFRSKTNTSITYNWSTSEACDYIAYHLDGGGAVQVWTGNATSGTFTVSGLTGGTTHSVYATCRRKDSQLSSNSNTVSNITTYKTPTLSLSNTAVDETSLTIKATPNVAIKSKTWTLKNSGGTTVKTSTSTNESVQFTGLSAGTSYTIYVSCVSNDANGAITSATYNATYKTTAYPTISKVNTAELVIGNAQTISITNPKGRNVTVHMRKEGASSDLQSWTTTTNGNFSFTPTTSTLYNSIPAAHNANCTYFLTYSTYTSPSKTGKYKIKETEAPTFTTSNWSYNVSNTYNALTGNDTSVVIKGYSTVNFTVGTAASSSYGATFTGSASGYVYNWGDGTVALTKTTTASIVAKNTNVIKITAYDDRGLSTISTRTLTNGTNYVDYSIPTITSAKTHRANGIDAATTLTLTGKLGYVGKFGTNGVTNTVASIKYKTKPASSSTWSSEYNLTGYTINTSTGEFSLTNAQIHENGTSGGFPVGTKYNVLITIKDAQGLLGSTTYQVDVTDGKIARDVYQDSNGEYHEGINGRADSNYTQKVYGSLNTTGNIYPSGQAIKNGGSSWVKDRDVATVRNNNTTQGGNYYPVVSQKTKDGNWTIGQLSGENHLRFNYTTDSNYNNNNNTSMQNVYMTEAGNMCANGFVAGVNENTTAERQVIAQSGAGKIYLASQASHTGAIGIYGISSASAGTPSTSNWICYRNNGGANVFNGNATNVTQKITASSKTHTNYNNNQGYVPSMSFLTFWNGAYNSSNNSNLTYCSGGTIENTTHTGRIGHFIVLSSARHTQSMTAWNFAQVTNMSQAGINGDTFKISGNTIYANRACKVLVIGKITHKQYNGSTSGDTELVLRVNSNNNSIIANSYTNLADGGWTNVTAIGLVSLSAGQTVDMAFNCGSARTEEILNGSTVLMAIALNT